MLKYQLVPVTAFEQNCSVIWCDETMQGAVVDPGGDLEKILAVVEQNSVKLTKILLTHGHIDHVGATAELLQRMPLPVIGPHEGDQFLIAGLVMQATMFGFAKVDSFEPDQWLQDGESVQVGNVTLSVSHCPGIPLVMWCFLIRRVSWRW